MNIEIEREPVVNESGELVRRRPRVCKTFTKPSLTRQEFKEECDLGLILKKFCRSAQGKAALENARGFAETARFGDVSVVPDFRAALDIVNAAKAKFMALPAIVRRRFGNDPAEFLDFCQDPNNLDEARSLGLCKPAQQDAAATPVSGA